MTALRPQIQRRVAPATDLLGVPFALQALVAAQLGVATREQLRGCGLDAHDVQRRTDDHRWRRFGPNVVILHNAPLTPEQRHWAAVLLLGKLCALAALSAATSWGLRGFEPDRVHIVVPHDTHVRAPAWVKLHESRRFGAADICTGSGPPRTSAARSLIDASAWSRAPRRACAILCAGVQQRLVRAASLAHELDVAGPVQHAAIMRAIVGDIGAGGHTLAEIDLGPLARRAGFAAPNRQQLRREPSGRVRYIDAELDLPDGTVLVVEIDGAVHLDPDVADDDQDRQNEIVICRNPVLRFSSLTVRLRPDRVVDQLRRMRLAYSR